MKASNNPLARQSLSKNNHAEELREVTKQERAHQTGAGLAAQCVPLPLGRTHPMSEHVPALPPSAGAPVKAVEDSPSPQVLAIHVEDQEGVPGFQFQAGPIPIVADGRSPSVALPFR